MTIQAKNFLGVIFTILFMTNAYGDAPSPTNENKKSVGSVLFIINPAKAEIKTEYTPETMVNLIEEYRTRALNGEFVDIGINTGFIEMDVKGEKAKLTFFTSSFGALKEAMKVKVSPEGEDKKLVVKARVPFCQMRDLYKNKDKFALGGGHWRFSDEVEERLEALLDL